MFNIFYISLWIISLWKLINCLFIYNTTCKLSIIQTKRNLIFKKPWVTKFCYVDGYIYVYLLSDYQYLNMLLKRVLDSQRQTCKRLEKIDVDAAKLVLFQDKQCVQKQQGAFGIQLQLSRNNSHTKYGSSYNAHHLRIFNKYFPILQFRIFQQLVFT